MPNCIFCGRQTTHTIDHQVLIEISDRFGNGQRRRAITQVPACCWCYEMRMVMPWVIAVLGFVLSSALVFKVDTFILVALPALLGLLVAYVLQRDTTSQLRAYQRERYEELMH